MDDQMGNDTHLFPCLNSFDQNESVKTSFAENNLDWLNLESFSYVEGSNSVKFNETTNEINQLTEQSEEEYIEFDRHLFQDAGITEEKDEEIKNKQVSQSSKLTVGEKIHKIKKLVRKAVKKLGKKKKIDLCDNLNSFSVDLKGNKSLLCLVRLPSDFNPKYRILSKFRHLQNINAKKWSKILKKHGSYTIRYYENKYGNSVKVVFKKPFDFDEEIIDMQLECLKESNSTTLPLNQLIINEKSPLDGDVEKFNRLVSTQPKNIENWIKLLEAQKKKMKRNKTPSALIIECQNETLKKALTFNGTSSQLIIKHLELSHDEMDDEQLNKILDDCLFKVPYSVDLWLKVIDITSNHLSLCVNNRISSLFSKAINMFSIISHGSFVSHQINEEEITKAHLRLLFESLIYFKESGFIEKVIAILQCNFEFNVFVPKLFKQKSIDFTVQLSLLKEYWSSNFPLIGEADWKSWVHKIDESDIPTKETDHNTKNNLVVNNNIYDGYPFITENELFLIENEIDSWFSIEIFRENNDFLAWKGDLTSTEAEAIDPNRIITFEAIEKFIVSSFRFKPNFLADFCFIFIGILGVPIPVSCLHPTLHDRSYSIDSMHNFSNDFLKRFIGEFHLKFQMNHHDDYKTNKKYNLTSMIRIDGLNYESSFGSFSDKINHPIFTDKMLAFIRNVFKSFLILRDQITDESLRMLSFTWLYFEIWLCNWPLKLNDPFIKNIKTLARSLLSLDFNRNHSLIWEMYTIMETLSVGPLKSFSTLQKLVNTTLTLPKSNIEEHISLRQIHFIRLIGDILAIDLLNTANLNEYSSILSKFCSQFLNLNYKIIISSDSQLSCKLTELIDLALNELLLVSSNASESVKFKSLLTCEMIIVRYRLISLIDVNRISNLSKLISLSEWIYNMSECNPNTHTKLIFKQISLFIDEFIATEIPHAETIYSFRNTAKILLKHHSYSVQINQLFLKTNSMGFVSRDCRILYDKILNELTTSNQINSLITCWLFAIRVEIDRLFKTNMIIAVDEDWPFMYSLHSDQLCGFIDDPLQTHNRLLKLCTSLSSTHQFYFYTNVVITCLRISVWSKNISDAKSFYYESVRYRPWAKRIHMEAIRLKLIGLDEIENLINKIGVRIRLPLDEYTMLRDEFHSKL